MSNTNPTHDDGSLYAASAAYVASQDASSVDCRGQMVRDAEAAALARTPWPKTPTMTRAHFDYIARIIAEVWPDDETSNTEHVAEHFAYHLADTNPRFSAERFVEAATR